MLENTAEAATTEAEEPAGYHYSATYSPDDNKLRLYAVSRLPRDLYDRVRAAGFKWAPKQELFVAPMWTPEREDLLLELAGEIDDEDKSLVERQEERAERFDGYSEKRLSDAERAKAAIAAIADNIPFGQPILIGHHSEKRARRDAEKIQNGMRRAVKMWETSKYWTDRAAGALAHAKYKELPQVRARRIKGIETDKRRVERNIEKTEAALKVWSREGLTHAQALFLAGHGSNPNCVEHSEYGYRSFWDAYDVLRPDGERPQKCPAMTVEQVQAIAKERFTRALAVMRRWLVHYEYRLSYERAMLEEQGASSLLEKKPRPKQLPLCNYRTPGLDIENPWQRGEMIHYPQVEITQAEYAKIHDDYKGTRVVDHSHRVRTAYINPVSGSYKRNLVCVFLTDSKVHERPGAAPAPVRTKPASRPASIAPAPKQEPGEFEAMRESLRGGVKVVSAPQLFPTPIELAGRIAEEANIQEGARVLEPSAGTGRLIQAIRARVELVAVELNHGLAEQLRAAFPLADARCSDFLQCTPEQLGTFDRIVMNPPFTDSADVLHVSHALRFLKPGGRLVAIMSAGVTFRTDRRTADFRRLVEERGGVIEPLPDDTFQESGTGVRTVLVIIDGE